MLSTAAASAGIVLSGQTAQAQAPAAAPKGPFELPKLAYAYNALEPHIDARTMEIHHSKHHQAYITNANKALESLPDFAKMSVNDLLANIGKVPEASRQTLINNAGGHANHSLFWEFMGPGKGGEPKGDLADAIKGAFGDFAKFKEEFGKAAATRFGSGWAWLSKDASGKLIVHSFANQDSPILLGNKPILGLDVWEHAYYLNYQNRRPDYVAAWWNVVNWDKASELFAAK